MQRRRFHETWGGGVKIKTHFLNGGFGMKIIKRKYPKMTKQYKSTMRLTIFILRKLLINLDINLSILMQHVPLPPSANMTLMIELNCGVKINK
jgi:hypothetical protein